MMRKNNDTEGNDDMKYDDDIEYNDDIYDDDMKMIITTRKSRRSECG